MVKVTHCRVCGAAFEASPVFELSGMPAAAQNFPDASNVHEDVGVDLALFQCSGCGLVQLDNEPVSYYKDVIRAAAFSDEMRAFRVEQFKTFVAEHGLDGKKILELGCGQGEYLEVMAEAGVQAYGLEHLQASVENCQSAGLNVSQGYPDSADLVIDSAPFDAFFILNFFEHLPDPNLALEVMRNNLVDGGLGLVELPNFDAIIEKNLFSEFINDHLFYFTKETLIRTMELNGFEVLASESVWYDYILSVVVRKRPRIELDNLVQYRERIGQEINAYLDDHPGKKCAIWGAGHQALAVMALADLKGRVDLVVDSASFKQGKLTPATHIPIKDPSTLGSENIDVVMVMAAAYSDEVVRIIEERFPALEHVAVLRDFGLEIVRG